MPKISIIVPVYNVEKYLKRCIDSILAQTFEDFELILVNDGSTDSSSNICDEYAKKDNRIKVIHKKNGGLSSARNAGIDISMGDYIGFVDSDDYININMYDILYTNIINYSADIAICDFIRVYDEKNLFYCKEVTIKNICKLNNIDALKEFYKNDRDKFIIACNKLYKKNMFNKLRYPNGKIHEDEFIAHKLFYNARKIIYIDGALYNYFQRSNSIMLSKFNIKRLDAIYAYKDRVDFFREIGNKELQYNAEQSFIEYFFKLYFKAYDELGLKYSELKKFRNLFCKDLTNILKNPKYNWKEKTMWIIFYINPHLYKKVRMKIS